MMGHAMNLNWAKSRLLAAAVVILTGAAFACGGSAGPEELETPQVLTPEGNATVPPNLTPLPITPPAFGEQVECVEVEAATFDSEQSLAGQLPEGKIAFVSFRDQFQETQNREIYLITPESDKPVNLTRNSCADDDPDWSPDGTKLVWSSDRDGDFDLYVMNADGSGVTQLTTEGGGLSPRWSPDGKLITYSRGGAIMVIDVGGGEPRPVLAPEPGAPQEELCRTGGFPGGWSPDSSRIVYYAASATAQVGHVCAVSLDGSEVETLVSEPPGYNVEPVWSPDGQRIAFRSIRDGNHDIYLVDSQGGNESRLTDSPTLDTEPDWSPSGEWIVFGANRDAGVGASTDIYVMRADGSDVRRLTTHPRKDSFPAWIQ